MTFWERLKGWLLSPEETSTRSTKSRSAAVIEPTATSDLPSPPTPPAMINTITLSSDLTRIYYVDNGKLIVFPLEEEAGVTIGLLNGQLAVVTPNKPAPTGVPPTPVETDEGASHRLAGRPGKPSPVKSASDRELDLPIKPNSQYSATYNSDTRTLSVIGALDIIITRDVPDNPNTDPTGNCALHLFDLDKSIINIRRVKDHLLITEKERK